jgi:malonyl-ACP decarboxylase/3-oxoacyl-[acyl-carrier-protein] synthase-1/3-oxoacyl-[acyl-carrier-protein] synthase II
LDCAPALQAHIDAGLHGERLDHERAGGADAVVISTATQELDPVVLQGWALMSALVWRSLAEDPTRASRPFDARR